MPDLLKSDFAAAVDALQPLGPAPRFAVAVSGGADSTALALLAQDWVRRHGGSIVALIVDHGLRAESGAEAEGTRRRLAERGIDGKILTLSGLPKGAGLQAAARAGRYAALGQGARAANAVYLLLGHHLADQAETVAMRAARGTGGLQGMACYVARNDVVVLRPLLSIAPERLRGFLRAEAMSWVEDASNADPRFERVRVRVAGGGARPEAPQARQLREGQAAAFLARHCVIRPEGFAVIHEDAAPSTALAALLRIIGGANYAPDRDAVAILAGRLRPATLGGVQIVKAGKLGRGWLMAREPAACAAPVAAVTGAIWDGRFRLTEAQTSGMLGALGADAPKFRHGSNLPAIVLRGLACIRSSRGSENLRLAPVVFNPPGPAAPHPFWAAAGGLYLG